MDWPPCGATSGRFMHIRKAHEDEAFLLSSIAMESKAFWGYAVEDLLKWKPFLTVHREMISCFPIYVAEVEGAVVGFYNLLPGNSVCCLHMLFVLPAMMRKGIGRALVRHAAEVAAELGSEQITIDADAQAEAFYISCGGRRVGGVHGPTLADPQRVRPQLILDLVRDRADAARIA